MVLSAGTQGFFGEENGIYARSSQQGMVAASVICLDPAGNKPAAMTEAAVSISGESSRYHDVSPKHSLRLRFAGPDSTAGVLTGGPGIRGRHVVLRHPTHDSWTVASDWAASRRNAKYFADAFAGKWLGDAGHLTLRRQWVHVFLNARYWGAYEAIEQNEADPAGISDLLEGGAGQQAEAIFGDVKSWRDQHRRLMELASAAMNGIPEDAAWQEAARAFDTASLIDYILLNCWMTNLDWPEHNYLIAKSGGLWHFLSWDAEWSMRLYDGPIVDMSQRLLGAGDGPAFVFSCLCWWPEFRAQVSSRLDALTAAGGLLHPESLADSVSTAASDFRRVCQWLGNPGTPGFWI